MKVAIYCRLSDEDRDKISVTDDSASIQNQKSMLITYAINRGWEIYSIYSDDDYSGADRNRPEFNRLLQDAQARKFNIVLFSVFLRCAYAVAVYSERFIRVTLFCFFVFIINFIKSFFADFFNALRYCYGFYPTAVKGSFSYTD